MSKTTKILILVSFLIVGMILITNEPPIYSRQIPKEHQEVVYDLSSINDDLSKDVKKIVVEKKNMAKAINYLNSQNKELKKTINELQIQEIIPIDSVTPIKDSVTIKKKGFIKRILNKK